MFTAVRVLSFINLYGVVLGMERSALLVYQIISQSSLLAYVRSMYGVRICMRMYVCMYIHVRVVCMLVCIRSTENTSVNLVKTVGMPLGGRSDQEYPGSYMPFPGRSRPHLAAGAASGVLAYGFRAH